MNKFFTAVRRDITSYNTALAKACKPELEGICSPAAAAAPPVPAKEGQKSAPPPTQFSCLKRHHNEDVTNSLGSRDAPKVSTECWAAVFQEEEAEAQDVRLSADLMDACAEDIAQGCQSV